MIRILVIRLLCLMLLAVAFAAAPSARLATSEHMALQRMPEHEPCPATGTVPAKERGCATCCIVVAAALPAPGEQPVRIESRARHLPGWSLPPTSRHPPPEDRPPKFHPAV